MAALSHILIVGEAAWRVSHCRARSSVWTLRFAPAGRGAIYWHGCSARPLKIREEAGEMRVEGGQTIARDAEGVFAALLDAGALARAIPGCERLIQLGPLGAGGAVAFEARVRAVGSVSTVLIRVTAARPPAYLRVELRGAGPGNAFSGRGAVDLVPRDGHTAAAYVFDVDATGVTDAASVSAEACRQIAETICARLSAGVRVAKPAEAVVAVAPLAELEETVQITRSEE